MERIIEIDILRVGSSTFLGEIAQLRIRNASDVAILDLGLDSVGTLNYPYTQAKNLRPNACVSEKLNIVGVSGNAVGYQTVWDLARDFTDNDAWQLGSLRNVSSQNLEIVWEWRGDLF